MSTDLSRRTFATAAAATAAVPLLAACGGGSSSASGGSTGGSSSTPSASKGSPSSGSAGSGLVAAKDVPVDGGVVVKDAKVVVTQPAQAQFKCFSAVCTHQGCLVGSVSDNTIHCPCHGSAFSATDGSVVNGPATAPLAEVAVKVAGGQVTRT